MFRVTGTETESDAECALTVIWKLWPPSAVAPGAVVEGGVVAGALPPGCGEAPVPPQPAHNSAAMTTAKAKRVHNLRLPTAAGTTIIAGSQSQNANCKRPPGEPPR